MTVKETIRDERATDKSKSAQTDPAFGDFERIAKEYLATDGLSCNDLDTPRDVGIEEAEDKKDSLKLRLFITPATRLFQSSRRAPVPASRLASTKLGVTLVDAKFAKLVAEFKTRDESETPPCRLAKTCQTKLPVPAPFRSPLPFQAANG